ncbi:energy transducer TonB [Sulfurimonas crateris]|uniref:Energy transducer TonB n=1 Tax=Sulfurimonas crateris TaxID=2574727 RepID=A0A4U2Z5S6_9BACT|nr:energy transducer TonB [Sulfurimonas crateris]TKI69254.1 energy transducer TonB [Sulfurimonas crateris]
MIRHSSSFFISIVIHLILLFSAFFAWSSYSETKDEYTEESLCIKLCNVNYEQEAVSEKKPIEPKVQKKIVEAPKPKPEPKPKPPKKEIAIEKALPKAQEIQKSEVLEEPKEEEKVVEVEQEKVQEVAISTPKKVDIEPKKEAIEPKSEQSREVDATDEYLKINTQMISQLIRENLYYPMAARKRNITGRVSVKFTLCSDGKVSNLEAIDSSSDILSRAALKTIEELSGKFPKPGSNITLTIPIEYSLN